MYLWRGMDILEEEEALLLHKAGQLTGCYWLYPDNTEGYISEEPDEEEFIQRFYEQGIQIGRENGLPGMDIALIEKPIDEGLNADEAEFLIRTIWDQNNFVPIEIKSDTRHALGFKTIDVNDATESIIKKFILENLMNDKLPVNETNIYEIPVPHNLKQEIYYDKY